MIFDEHANLKYNYGSRHFYSEGYYVSTVGLNCHITLWTVFKISLGSVYDDMINSVLCINFANGCQEDFIFCLILLSDLLAKQNQNSTHETMAEINSVIQNECHTPTA